MTWQSDSDLKNINKVEKINEKISQLKSRVKQLKTEVEAKQLTLMIKADKSAKAIRNRHIGETKCIQLRQKHAQWLEKVSEEQKFVEKLESSTPAEDTSIKKNNCESTIKRLIQFLDSFYADVGDCPIFVTQRHNVEKNIQNIIADVPVFTLFEAIQCYSEKGIKIVDQTFNSNDDHSSNDSVSSAIDVAISKSRIKIYVSHLKTKNLKSEHATCVENYFYLYDQYLNKIIAEMKAFNALDTELFAESICNDYLKVHGTWMCNQVLSEIHQQKLANLQRRATERDDLLKGEELVASELSAMYEAIEKTYNLILNDLMALGNVNQNMKQMQAVSRYTINNFGSKNTWNTSLNTSAVVPSITINSVPTEYFNELSKLSDVVCKDWRKLRQMM
ncbi:hypothetical protein Bhyg_08892 [Pseudolycoriella hygida]|uniref:Uncharacterized protein n=1 Tax=Pseudolycoriella hygida TaxID=35572 RepID=A0A9Q0N5H0_9DIPT|nr:hypothetical protein Bhyg_08892 [Pseudolycoriella hygida]